MKKITAYLSTLILLITVYAFAIPPIPYTPVTGLTDASNVNITNGNATLTNLTVSNSINATNTTWTGFNVGTGTIDNFTSTNADITELGAINADLENITVSTFAGAGISSSTSSNATNVVATSNAVKIAYDLADSKQDASANLTVLAGNSGANLTDIPVASVVGAANAIYRGNGTALVASSLTDDGSGNVSASGNVTVTGLTTVTGGLKRATPVTHAATEAATAATLYGTTHLVSGAYTVTLPAVAIGMHGRFYATTAAVYSVDCDGADHFVLSGTALTAGNKVTSDGSAGAYFDWEVTAANTITIFFSNVTFIDGGA